MLRLESEYVVGCLLLRVDCDKKKLWNDMTQRLCFFWHIIEL